MAFANGVLPDNEPIFWLELASSHYSSITTRSSISQSLSVTPAAIAGVTPHDALVRVRYPVARNDGGKIHKRVG